MAVEESKDGGNGSYIRISNREVYDAVMRLEGKMEALLGQKERVQDHESRIRALESRFVGVAVAAVTVFFGGMATVIWRVLAK